MPGCFIRRTARPVLASGLTTALVFLASLWLVSPETFAQSEAKKRELAVRYFERAQDARRALEEIPSDRHTQKDYENAIQAYRRVYLTAPRYTNDPQSLLAIGELYEAMGRRWGEKYYREAIKTYEFLLREYPHGSYRFEVPLTIAGIYRTDLGKPEEALKQYQQYVDKYPRSAQAKAARQAVAEISKQLEELEARLKEAEGRPAEDAAQTAAKPVEAGSPQDVTKAPGHLAQITSIRSWGTPTSARVVIDLEREVKYETGRVGDPPRIYVDLYETGIAPAVSGQTAAEPTDLLKNVRTGRFRPGVTRVVLEVAGATDYQIFDLPNPNRLVIDVAPGSGKGPPSPAGPTTVAGKSAPAKPTEQAQKEDAASPNQNPGGPPPATQQAKASPPDPQIEKIQPARPIRGGVPSLTRALGLKIGRIIIDPGHGGSDTGTIGPSGYTEKELVLDVSQRLGNVIGERLGSEVLYTRQDDIFLPLAARTALANDKGGDLFVSIHANSSRNRSARGIETYYLNFTSDPEALEVASRENAVTQETISQLQTLVQKIALQEKIEESKEFATRVQASLRENLAAGNRRKMDRGVKKAPFMVLVGAHMPAILVEIAFLSNPQDEKALRSPEYLQKIAESIYAGIERYAETLSGVKVAQSAAPLQ